MGRGQSFDPQDPQQILGKAEMCHAVSRFRGKGEACQGIMVPLPLSPEIGGKGAGGIGGMHIFDHPGGPRMRNESKMLFTIGSK